ncbi:MAG TPA: hypothetical protein VGG77_04720 [Roseiarcus sp.]
MATFQSPLTGFFQLIAAISGSPCRCETVSALSAGICRLIDQKRMQKDEIKPPFTRERGGAPRGFSANIHIVL